MTDSAHPDRSLPEDRTRDITLPPLPDRPPPAMPKEWAGLRPSADAPTTALPGPVAPPPAEPAPSAPAAAAPPVTAISREDAVARIEARMLASQRTDEMQQPPASTRRDRTLSFSSPEMRQRPVEPVAVGRTSRRWPWVVLTLLPILVIVGAGIAWVLLLEGA
ncbi:hypothetical protein GCU60_13085 [Blastococcus saxobsidens]|uniref:Uncharacterized protein n=1 Tax=Blastococcus saxobsidens TaxID=138336 RepID=A0A6L9W5F6_9ACTN|nr:hypothetical protein [Blastococcus saxobsidens]NEK86680.1 hypothetical protein [Blastococcus saxobsidens]